MARREVELNGRTANIAQEVWDCRRGAKKVVAQR